MGLKEFVLMKTRNGSRKDRTETKIRYVQSGRILLSESLVHEGTADWRENDEEDLWRCGRLTTKGGNGVWMSSF